MHRQKKVLVTGGAGFIGSHAVVELDAAGYAPVIMDNFSNSHRAVSSRIAEICGKVFPVHEGDCRDMHALRTVFEAEEDIWAVIHFAAFKAVGESVVKPALYYDNNIGSMAQVLMVMEAFGVTNLVFSSSCTVYGQPEKLPVTEDSPIQLASSPYGYTKQVCEQLIEDVVRSGKPLHAVTLRYFNPIGAHPSGLIGELPLGTPNNLVPYITQAAAGIRSILNIYGNDYGTHDGTAKRDYIHVVDLARAHVKALDLIATRPENSYNHIVNIGTGQGKTVLEVVRAFEKVTGSPLPHQFVDRRPGDVEAVWAATTDESRLPGWQAMLSLEDALRDAWHWQQKLGSTIH